MAAIFTLCLETGVECTYPVPEGTTAGLQLLCAQVFGVIFITGTTPLASHPVWVQS